MQAEWIDGIDAESGKRYLFPVKNIGFLFELVGDGRAPVTGIATGIGGARENHYVRGSLEDFEKQLGLEKIEKPSNA